MIADVVEKPEHKSLIVTCPTCRGRGKRIPIGGRIKRDCDVCHGEGSLDVYNNAEYWEKYYETARKRLVEIKIEELELLKRVDLSTFHLTRLKNAK